MLLETLPPKTHEAPGAGHVEHEPASSQTVVPAALLATALDGLGIVLFVVDSHGRVVVEHSSTGRCTVYVDGRDCGTMHAPGTFAATLR